MATSYDFGVDIGGTFTDIVCRGSDGRARILKLPTTRSDPSQGVLAGLEHAANEWQVGAADIARFVHGTTVATNAVLERKGARIGIITTAGFKDVLEIGRQKRSGMYDLVLEPETPIFLAPGARRKEVAERIAADGEVLTPLDEDQVMAAADALVGDGVEALAIVFLFSFVNPAHEIRAAECIRARYPELMLSLSSEVDPAFREFERTAVTAFDAYVKPVLNRYLSGLEASLQAADVGAPLQIMLSRGGVSSAETACRRPVRLLLSGPAAGVVGGQATAVAADLEDLITIDIGGTSCDIALIEGGRPVIRAEGTIAEQTIRVPMVDINAIGAGGGSIAALDRAGGLRVGPASAGAEPGPACYGRGGAQPTVTDGSLVLGYLNPEAFAGGALRLQPELARRAIESTLAGPMGLSVEAAALGIHRVLNAKMAEGIRLVSIRRGHDPRRFALVALGGGGPVHACALADHLDIGRIVIPRHPGVLSAAGLLAAPVEQELSVAFSRPLCGLSKAELDAAFSELDRRCANLMAGEAIGAATIETQHFADVCYIGQAYHLEVALDPADENRVDRLYDDFRAEHDRIYGYAAETPARIVNLRSVHQAQAVAAPDDAVVDEATAETRIGERTILLPDPWGDVLAKIYQRTALTPDMTLEGPAIIEQADTTVLVEPGWRTESLSGGHLLMRKKD